ncbi:MAG: type I phosphomannose isomerase catalytic subunit [Verrucomicrobiia bacterium]
MLYSYRFTPLLMERVWGGRALARFGKRLPPNKLIGESWEISDRDDAQSVVTNGPDKGKTLHQLVETLGSWLLGANSAGAKRFPLLVKLLDARERLSLQVHPPAAVAAKLGGEPKTEMWYIIDAAGDAHLIAGLRRGVTRTGFEQALRCSSESLADLVHRIPVRKGDAMLVPSGRLHSIDAGLVIAEIQQNSDTTCRVFDWNRVGLDGKPRHLHPHESLASIDFADFEPQLNPLPIGCKFFRTELISLSAPRADRCDGSTFHIIGCVDGSLVIRCSKNSGQAEERLATGEFALLPAAFGHYTLAPAAPGAKALKVFVPGSKSI